MAGPFVVVRKLLDPVRAGIVDGHELEEEVPVPGSKAPIPVERLQSILKMAHARFFFITAPRYNTVGVYDPDDERAYFLHASLTEEGVREKERIGKQLQGFLPEFIAVEYPSRGTKEIVVDRVGEFGSVTRPRARVKGKNEKRYLVLEAVQDGEPFVFEEGLEEWVHHHCKAAMLDIRLQADWQHHMVESVDGRGRLRYFGFDYIPIERDRFHIQKRASGEDELEFRVRKKKYEDSFLQTLCTDFRRRFQFMVDFPLERINDWGNLAFLLGSILARQEKKTLETYRVSTGHKIEPIETILTLLDNKCDRGSPQQKRFYMTLKDSYRIHKKIC